MDMNSTTTSDSSATSSSTSDPPTEGSLEAWKEVYLHLSIAILKTKQSIAAERNKMHHTLCEIVENVTPDGRLADDGAWMSTRKQTMKGSASKIGRSRGGSSKKIKAGAGAGSTSDTTSNKRKKASKAASPAQKKQKVSSARAQTKKQKKIDKEEAKAAWSQEWDANSPTNHSASAPEQTQHDDTTDALATSQMMSFQQFFSSAGTGEAVDTAASALQELAEVGPPPNMPSSSSQTMGAGDGIMLPTLPPVPDSFPVTAADDVDEEEEDFGF